MQYRTLGHTPFEVPVLSLGSWQTLERLEEARAFEIMSVAIEAGFTFFDDARYTDRTGSLPMESGYSEVVFGNLLRKGGWPREQLFIADKLWFEFFPQQGCEAELDAAMARMQTDYIDLLYCAPPPDDMPLEDLIETMHGLVRAGKTRCWGLLNWRASMVEKAVRYSLELDLIGPCAIQLPYSLLKRRPVESARMQAACSSGEISIIASASLAGGLLTGKYNDGSQPPGARLDAEQLSARMRGDVPGRLQAFSQQAQRLCVSESQLALAWCLGNSQVCSLVFGAMSLQQLRENLGALELLERIDDDTLMRLRDIFRDEKLDGSGVS